MIIKSNQRWGRKMVTGGLGLFVLAMSSVRADEQKVTIKITDVQVEDAVYTPYYNVETEQEHQQGAAQKWIRLGVYFTTSGGWIDQLTVKQMAAIRQDSEDPVYLSETVNYINIEPGDHYVYVYLHPSYVKRYNVDAFELDSAVIISIDDTVVATKETIKHCEKGWYECKGDAKDKNYLLNHAETPFWFINYDFKEIIKKN